MLYILNLKKIMKNLVLISILVIFVLFLIVWFNFLFPLKYYDLIKKYSDVYDVDSKIVISIINVESRFKKYAKSSKGASGLMQIRKITADWAAKEIGIENYDYSKIFDPKINIQIGVWYISNLIKQYNGNLDLALASYNAGTGNVSSWLKNPNYCLDGKKLLYIPFDETRKYIKKVELNLKVYSIVLWRLK